MNVLKKVFYFWAVVSVIGVLVLVGTAIMQMGMMLLMEHADIAFSEDTLYGLSGTLGVGLAAMVLYFFITKNYAFVEQREVFQAGKAVQYALLVTGICQIVFCVVPRFCFLRYFLWR